MRLSLAVFCALALIHIVSAAVEKAPKCDKQACQLPNCRCSSRDIPGGFTAEEVPQFVLLTFDDAVTTSNIDFFRKATLNYERGNPDGCPSAMTFFLSHEYTDYSLVHELYANGHEIALHSISHSENDIFSNEKVFQREFGDQRDMVARFANINKKDIQGIRMPYLTLGSDVQFDYMAKNNFTYDCSWVTQNQVSPGLWPYTLDYASLQECLTQENCPKGSHPGIWEVPMLSWRDSDNRPCAMFDGCITLPKLKSELVKLMIENFNRTYLTNKAPIGLFTHASWLARNTVNFDAYLEFLDYLSGLNDVYMVTAQDLLKWMRNPVPLSEMTTDAWSQCRLPTELQCDKKLCELKKPDREEVWFAACVSQCPAEYPWILNKYGEAKPKIKRVKGM